MENTIFTALMAGSKKSSSRGDITIIGCSSLKVVETTAGDKAAFLKIETLSDSNSVENMFTDCKDGSIVEPVAGKAYKCVVD